MWETVSCASKVNNGPPRKHSKARVIRLALVFIEPKPIPPAQNDYFLFLTLNSSWYIYEHALLDALT